MVIATWKEGTGWETSKLKSCGPLSLLPTPSCLHYAHKYSQGLKTYRGYDGKLRLFRPGRNARRLQISTERVSLPRIDSEELKKLVMALLSIGGPKWLPKCCAWKFLYVRPTIIGSNSQLGIQPSQKQAILYIIISYMKHMNMQSGGKHLLTSPGVMVRWWVGGFGDAKVGANYGPSVNAIQDAYRQ